MLIDQKKKHPICLKTNRSLASGIYVWRRERLLLNSRFLETLVYLCETLLITVAKAREDYQESTLQDWDKSP